jgi:hypothetical protein
MRKLVGFSGSDSDAQVRILPPQAASQSLTHTESGRARNATKSTSAVMSAIVKRRPRQTGVRSVHDPSVRVGDARPRAVPHRT